MILVIITSLNLNNHVMFVREAFLLLLAILLFLAILTQLQYSLPWVGSFSRFFLLLWSTCFFLRFFPLILEENCFVYCFGESEIRWCARTIKFQMETIGIFLNLDLSIQYPCKLNSPSLTNQTQRLLRHWKSPSPQEKQSAVATLVK